MKYKIFSIYDTAARAYLTPFFLPEEGQAIRTLKGCANDPEHAFGRNPEDYTLFNLGAFDDSSGTLTVNKTLIKVVTALELQALPDVKLSAYDRESHSRLKQVLEN